MNYFFAHLIFSTKNNSGPVFPALKLYKLLKLFVGETSVFNYSFQGIGVNSFVAGNGGSNIA